MNDQKKSKAQLIQELADLRQQLAIAIERQQTRQNQGQAEQLLDKRVKELNCLTDIGRKMADTPPVPELLEWVAGRIPPAMQYPELCKVGINYQDQMYGAAEAAELPAQIVNALRIGPDVVGKLYIAYTEKHDFLDEESTLLGGVAARISGYLEGRYLLEQSQSALAATERQAQRLSTLNAISKALTQTSNEDEVYQALAGRMAEIFETARISLALLTPDGDRFNVLALDGDKGVIPTGATLPVAGTFIEEAFEKRQVMILADTSSSDYLETRKLSEQGILSTLVAPLIVSGELLGSLNIGSQYKYAYDIQDQQLMQQIASLVASTLENQKLLAQTRAVLAETEASQALMRTVLDATPDWIFVKDQNHRYQLANKAYADDMGMNVEDVIGKDDLEVGFPEDIVKGSPEKGIRGFWPDDDEIFATGSTKLIEVAPAVVGGKTIFVNTIKAPVRDVDGNIWGVLGYVRDITERENLLNEVKRLADIVENHPDFIGIGTLEGVALYINPAGLNMVGLPPDQDIGRIDFSQFIPPDEVEVFIQESIPTALETGSWTGEGNLLRSDGTTVAVEKTVSVSYDANKKPVSFNITMRDITARKEADAERERLLAEVEEAYRQYVRGEWEQVLSDPGRGKWHFEHQQADIPQITEAQEIFEYIQQQVINDGKIKAVSKANQNNGHGNEPLMIAPVSLRGETIGTISLQDIDPDRRWTADEIALVETVSEQLALTLENLRLFDDTQKRAARERLTREIADKMRSSPDIDSIVQTGLTELANVLGVPNIYVKLMPELPQANGESLDSDLD